jgi:hypothetical protein
MVLATVLAGATACGHDRTAADSSTQTTSPRPSTSTSTTQVPEPKGHLIASARVPVEVFASPSTSQAGRLLQPGLSGELVFLVRRLIVDSWLEVDLPIRPNGSVGFVRRADVELARTRFSVDVYRGDHRLVVRYDDAIVFEAPIAVGKTDTPTPGGRFYITQLIRTPRPTGDYGPFVFALSGFSPTLESFAGGDGVIGIHGTDEPWLVGTDVSHGCIRLRNEDLVRLVEEVGLPLGTPVTIDA